jgi:two-component system nitrogen regulation sensor histidine kinase NtrY
MSDAGRPGFDWRSLSIWARRRNVERYLAIFLTIAALVSGIATFGVMTGASSPVPNPRTVLILLNIDLAIFVLLGTVVARRIVKLWLERRRGGAGARLHVRLVFLFSLIAGTPSILMAVLSVVYLNIGIEGWFSSRVSTALKESLEVAKSYLKEHQQLIAGDALAMVNDINRDGASLVFDNRLFTQFIQSQALNRGLTEAVVFEGTGKVIAKTGYVFALQFEQVPFWALDRAQKGEVAVVPAESDDRIRALVRIESMPGIFLYVGRFVDAKVLGHLERTKTAVDEYIALEGKRSNIERRVSLIFIVVALLFLLAASWVGLVFATRLATPIIALIDAAERVREGDLAVRVENIGAGDEIGTLSRAFNRMTGQLESQRRELVETNRELDERRRFSEAVLEGVSSAVIGLDADGRINLPNRSAYKMFGDDLASKIGSSLVEFLPEIADLYEMSRKRMDRLVSAEIILSQDGAPRTLLSSISSERLDEEIIGFVATFDDITDLQSAQRKAAWADVARRIAHEIKNPLTPIQLSAERLKRKYLKEIKSDPEIFSTCTDTIIRQVGEIGRMVDEFSDFARMPAPVFKMEDLPLLVRQALFLQMEAHQNIVYVVEMPSEAVFVSCDARQIGRALTNLAKNAAEAIEGREPPKEGEPPLPSGKIRIGLLQEPERLTLFVEDNGKGLPKDERHRLTEPYVTTRAKGTGLGLAIVKKIMEDHGGVLNLEDSEIGGARVSLIFENKAKLSIVPVDEPGNGNGA